VPTDELWRDLCAPMRRLASIALAVALLAGCGAAAAPVQPHRPLNIEEWRSSRAFSDVYVPRVQRGNVVALNGARVPFAIYINEIHARLHATFEEELQTAREAYPELRTDAGSSEVTYRLQRRAGSSHQRGTYGAQRRAFREGPMERSDEPAARAYGGQRCPCASLQRGTLPRAATRRLVAEARDLSPAATRRLVAEARDLARIIHECPGQDVERRRRRSSPSAGI
jgi:hypothetical protein